jgi:hypothetical protein
MVEKERNRLREAAITSQPDDAGQSFNDVVVEDVIDVASLGITLL